MSTRGESKYNNEVVRKKKKKKKLSKAKIEIKKNKLVEYAKSADKYNLDLIKEIIYLKPKEEAFACAYAVKKDIVKAVIEAGICKPNATIADIYQQGYKMWKKEEVKKRVRQLMLPVLYESQMTAEMAINEMAKIAFSDIMDFIQVKKFEYKDKVTNKKEISHSVVIDPIELERLKKLGLTSIIQEIKVGKDGLVSLKLCNKQDALNQISNILLGEKKLHLIQGKVEHEHKHEFKDLVEILSLPNDSQDKKVFMEKFYPENNKRRALKGDVNFEDIEEVDFEVIEKKEKKKRKGRKKEFVLPESILGPEAPKKKQKDGRWYYYGPVGDEK
jgi:hypothetical protein